MCVCHCECGSRGTRAHDTLASPRLNGNQRFLSSFAYRSSYRVEQSIFESYQQQATRSTTRKALNRTQRKEKKGEKRNERFSSLLRPALCLCLQIEIVFFDNVPLFILMNESNVMLLLLLHWILHYCNILYLPPFEVLFIILKGSSYPSSSISKLAVRAVVSVIADRCNSLGSSSRVYTVVFVRQRLPNRGIFPPLFL